MWNCNFMRVELTLSWTLTWPPPVLSIFDSAVVCSCFILVVWFPAYLSVSCARYFVTLVSKHFCVSISGFLSCMTETWNFGNLQLFTFPPASAGLKTLVSWSLLPAFCLPFLDLDPSSWDSLPPLNKNEAIHQTHPTSRNWQMMAVMVIGWCVNFMWHLFHHLYS